MKPSLFLFCFHCSIVLLSYLLKLYQELEANIVSLTYDLEVLVPNQKIHTGNIFVNGGLDCSSWEVILPMAGQ